MSDTQQPRVLIAGAGAMGIVSSYHLALSGAAVTFLVRPHRVDAVERPQRLYCYDDGALKAYEGYELISDPATLSPGAYDYVVITLDGAAMRDPDGERLARAIGRVARGTSTGVILGALGIELRSWFLSVSELLGEQVTNGTLGIQCHPVAGVTLPLHAPTDADLLAQADFAYRHCWPLGFSVDDSAPGVAQRFAALYSANGISRCVIEQADEKAAGVFAFFAQMAACDIGGWPSPADIDPDSDFWQLGIAAGLEIQGLGIFGEAGRKARTQTTAEGALQFWRGWERDMLPLDLQGFNRFHHGGKVNRQDLQILADCIAQGEAEGTPMTATRELHARQAALKG
ncbi:ketopantoate reductase family protein [Paenirhodobacter populi]|uniref:Ketopantoate reductase n=1 Tax=Paenirhodobacter populi TaxID=2306993 RepID=A0A443IKC1_9RHOB|nr:2-dehydropantoate 2-reductase N-terminal domain-containing protein [Sinirhodobacter populi]RWR05194.1 ketopantoate reductase [Sinirhodobacter populi]